MKKLILVTIIILFTANLIFAADYTPPSNYIQKPVNVLAIQIEEPYPTNLDCRFKLYQSQRRTLNTNEDWIKDTSNSTSFYNLADIEGCSYNNINGLITIELSNLSFDYIDYYIALADNPYFLITAPILWIEWGEADAREYTDAAQLVVLQSTSSMYWDGEGWNTDNPLPITLSSFTAVLTEGVPYLQWITQSEVNNAGWNVYRSETESIEDGLKVNSALIEGSGTSSQQTQYKFLYEYGVDTGTTYQYWLESISFNGDTETHGPVSLYIPTEEEGETPEVPIVYGLHQNYPNPFNPDTFISFALEEDGPAKLDIYNIKGQKVINLYNEEETEKDINITVYWDGCNQKGEQVSSGVYFYRLETSGKTYNRKMLLTK